MSLNNQHQYWNSVANDKTFTHPVDVPLLSRYVKSTAAVVDYGCGYGRVVKILSDNGFTNVAGYDTSEKLIERGLAQAGNLFHIDSPADLPLRDNSVDCILLFAVLTCIPANRGQVALIDLLHSKLKPEGLLYISDYYLQTGSTEMEWYEHLNNDPENFGVFSLPEGATFRHHTRDWIETLLANFILKEETSIAVKTMNGHDADAFQIIAQKQ